MSLNESISDIVKQINNESDFEKYMNPPSPFDGQAYTQKDYKTGILWVHCCHCGKKQFSITDETRIHKLPWKCKASSCKKEFEINVE